jgi:hypothetical protein
MTFHSRERYDAYCIEVNPNYEILWNYSELIGSCLIDKNWFIALHVGNFGANGNAYMTEPI